DLLQRHVVRAVLQERGARRVQQPGVVALGVGPHRARLPGRRARTLPGLRPGRRAARTHRPSPATVVLPEEIRLLYGGYLRIVTGGGPPLQGTQPRAGLPLIPAGRRTSSLSSERKSCRRRRSCKKPPCDPAAGPVCATAGASPWPSSSAPS